MCLILFTYNDHTSYRLVIAANRDEFYNRPTAPLQFWQDHPDVLAGRDLKSMGTWIGVTRSGRFAAITNYREPGKQIPDAPSRGFLISDFLTGSASPAVYLNSVKETAGNYNGFNLLVGDSEQLVHYSNRGGNIRSLESGIFGLSNRLLDTDWPKVRTGKRNFASLVNGRRDIPPSSLLELLLNQHVPSDDQLPDTGIGIEWERLLSPIYITSPKYGTRCSTILTIDRFGKVSMSEYTWKQGLPMPVLQKQSTFNFEIAQSSAA